jgi:hypothetical protein
MIKIEVHKALATFSVSRLVPGVPGVPGVS